MDGYEQLKQIFNEAILQNLDIPKCRSSNNIRVADLGCAAGPRTFLYVQNILDAVELKYQNQGLSSQIPEFQVFFNDKTYNDFNTLFASLPPNRPYYAVGVPVPKEMADRSSPAWTNALNEVTDEVIEAYSAQHAKDMAQFLDVRAQEVVEGGLMILFFPSRRDGTPPSQFRCGNSLLSCLMDMAKKGKVSEEKADSLNLPAYIMSFQELKEAIDRNGCFNMVKLESRHFECSRWTAQEEALGLRSFMGGLIKEHFGDEILEEVFESCVKKMEENYSQSAKKWEKWVSFAVLKRKTIH